jgi:hypothetical protein
VTQDVFDVFDADMAGTHDLDHGTLRLCGAEQLGEEAEAQAFAADGAGCGREGVEITSTHGAEPRGGDLARVSLSSVAQFTTMGLPLRRRRRHPRNADARRRIGARDRF